MGVCIIQKKRHLGPISEKSDYAGTRFDNMKT